jgi:hypothetical protein
MTLKNWWRNRPYWLRGGLIGAIILFIIMQLTRLLIYLFSFTRKFFFYIYKILAVEPLRFFGNFICSIGDMCLLTVRSGITRYTPFPTFLGTVILLIIYFIIGVIIGLIISKIKSKKKVKK